MAQPNTPHPLTLRVLRLSRPALATQTPLPATTFSSSGLNVPPQASLAHPSAETSSSSPLTPLLTLPASFGAAYVGETFSCTLCLNNELSTASQTTTNLTGVRVVAELQTPSNPAGIPLDLSSPEDGEDHSSPSPGATVQKTLSHDLKEPGPHVLAVTVNYTETSRAVEGEAASGGRARTFRKLYQFVAQPVLAVRSKVSSTSTAGSGGRRWVLEAQLENVGEGRVVVDGVWLNAADGVGWKGGVGGDGAAVVLKPRDVEQVMFVVEEKQRASGSKSLAQVEIDWRSAMGEKGKLITGWLTAKE